MIRDRDENYAQGTSTENIQSQIQLVETRI